MAIDSNAPIDTILAYLDECRKLAIDYTCRALTYLAEECVNRVRDRSADESWIDHTGNLRSSIGYIITNNGEVMSKGGFKPVTAPDGNGSEGQKKGSDYAQSIVSTVVNPIVLVVVAGMEYAIYVEARKNKDVLADTELWARSEWTKREPKLKASIEAGWEALKKRMKIA